MTAIVQAPRLLLAATILVGNSCLHATILSTVSPIELQCEHLTDPLGIDVEQPRLSWQLANSANNRGQRQTGYHILVASSAARLAEDQGDVWDSGMVASPQSSLVPLGGLPLRSGQDCHWKVQIRDRDGKLSAWSPPARFTVGLLNPEDWIGPWIYHPTADASKHLWFRRNLTLDQALTKALLHVASAGYHELYVNGDRIDDRVLAPALTRLDKRVLYVTYDLAAALKPGTNTVAFWTGPGWARYSFFKTRPALRVQLLGTTADGRSVTLASDADWRCEISSSENYGGTKYNDNGGERVDARRYLVGWNTAGFDDGIWLNAAVTNLPATLSAQMVEPTRVIETIAAQRVSGSGPYHVDMGKNFTGWIELRMSGQVAGDVVALQIADDAETVQDYGQKSVYVCRGQPGETFRNRFNYSAGRYLTISGLHAPPRTNDITGFALSTDVRQVGRFACSHELFNRIYSTDLWTWRANTIEGFTSDCPHRERLGYGEECFATAWGISLPNYRSAAFHAKQVRDWADVQETNGWINHTAPQINQHYGGPMWSSAGLNVAWESYQALGDQRMLEFTYAASRRWLEFLANHVTNGLLKAYAARGKFLRDWEAPHRRREWGDTPEVGLFNNCVYAMNLATFTRIAGILGHTHDVAFYSRRLEQLKPRVHEQFFSPTQNTYALGYQVHQAFPLLTSITPEPLRPAVQARFEEAILHDRPYLDMGSSGLPILLKYLIEDVDRADILCTHLAKTNDPSYGYFLARGETTWPEYWNVTDADSRIHTCYTGIAAWFIKGLCGLRPDPARPGGQDFLIQPAVVGDLTFAEGAAASPCGIFTSRWERRGDAFSLAVNIPVNARATVFIPANSAASVRESGRSLQDAPGVEFQRWENSRTVAALESGNYVFTSHLPGGE